MREHTGGPAVGVGIPLPHAQTGLLEGQPYEEIVTYAESNDIDMIVLGVRGHGLVKTLFLGSTTDRVVRRSPCPVLSVSLKVQNE